MSGKLYIVATPIGNLEDITLRAIKILSEVDIILAEDTRVTSKLVTTLNLERRTKNKPKLVSYHHHSGFSKKNRILKDLLEGKNIALVTDAGTPGISDPGNELIDFLYENCRVTPFTSLENASAGSNPAKQGDSLQMPFEIIPIPGPSSLSAAISICGFDMTRFLFLGFWPKKKVSKLIKLVKLTKVAVVFFDSPHRIRKTLARLEVDLGGDRRVFVGRELTKMYEETFRGKISDLPAGKAGVRSQMESSDMRGEVVVVVEK